MQRSDKQAHPLAVEAGPRLNFGSTVTILGLGLAMRLLVIWTVVMHFPPRWLFTRGMEMGLLAQSILAGKGLSSPFGADTGPTAIVAPVYPILVAGVFRIFGAYSLSSAIFILAAQMMVNLVTIWLIMWVSRRVLNQTSATIAGLIWSCSLPLAWMPTILWETSLSCCLLVGLVAIAIKYRAMSDPGPARWMMLGGYCGICALVNPALLLSVMGIVAWLVVVTRGKRSYRPLLSLLTFVLVFAPWPLRNARVFHAFVPLRTTVGLELWMGNRAGATGFLDESVFPMFNSAELKDYMRRGEVGYSAHKSALAKQYISAHPREFVALTTRRFFRFWTGTGTQNGSRMFSVHASTTTILGLIALGFLARRRRYETMALLLIPMLLFPIPYLITHAEFRYRLVIDPVLTVAASFVLAELWTAALQRIQKRELQSAAARTSPQNRPVWRAI